MHRFQKRNSKKKRNGPILLEVMVEIVKAEVRNNHKSKKR